MLSAEELHRRDKEIQICDTPPKTAMKNAPNVNSSKENGS